MVHLLHNSEELVGYRVRIWTRDAFRVAGYTRIFPPGRKGENGVSRFWDEALADGRVERLIGASSVPTCTLGLGSWDPECPKSGMRYTICIEETEHTDLAPLAATGDLFTKQIGASDWMCFETTFGHYMGRFWKDNPYKMMGPLGYEFHGAPDFSLGLHFEAYPPGFGGGDHETIEFWISVAKSRQ